MAAATKTKTKETTDKGLSTYDNVRLAAEQIRSDEHESVSLEPGEALRQGDLYVVALDRTLPGKPFGTRQLAPGTTQGSRHVAEGDCEILRVDEGKARSILNRLIPPTKYHQPFIGPMILAKGPVTIVHPDHGDRTIPAGSYLVVYQRNYAAQEIRRQMD